MGASPAPSHPLDRALQHLLSDKPEAALAEALPVLEAHPTPATLLVTGLALERVQAKEAAEVLRCAAYVASLSRSLPLAAGAIGALTRLGEKVSDELDSLAAVFSRVATSGGPAAPPVLDAESFKPATLPL